MDHMRASGRRKAPGWRCHKKKAPFGASTGSSEGRIWIEARLHTERWRDCVGFRRRSMAALFVLVVTYFEVRIEDGFLGILLSLSSVP
jgi:hypothetical protein